MSFIKDMKCDLIIQKTSYNTESWQLQHWLMGLQRPLQATDVQPGPLGTHLFILTSNRIRNALSVYSFLKFLLKDSRTAKRLILTPKVILLFH